MAVREAVQTRETTEVNSEFLQETPGHIRGAGSSLARLDLRMVAAVAYALLVLAMWGTFSFSSGMPGETGFAFQSQTQSVWQGFWYVDPLRP
ncbi:MAG: hypothetical protein DMG84_14500, partial [Acidobacteria bacterium]